MANICDNTFYAEANNKENSEYIINFLTENFKYELDITRNDEDFFIEAQFESKWVFPIEIMEELYKGLPDKENVYMRCLSVEYGLMYHALWECLNEEGWKQV